MSYTADIPVTGDSLGGTRDRIRTNFQLIQSLITANHEDFGSGFGQGKHKFLQMPEQGSAPATAVNEGGLYTKVGTNPAETNLFFRAEDSGGGGGFEYQLTKVIAVSTALFGNNTVAYVANNNGGWTFLPGGLVMQYGRRTTPGSSGTVSFPIPFPSGNAPFSIVMGNERNSARACGFDTISSTGFTYYLDTSGSTAVNWIAIGN